MNAAEAADAVAGGADILDAKNPAAGALGALPPKSIEMIVAVARAAGVKVSATIGDLPCEVASVAAAVDATLATGVHYVKIGLFPGAGTDATIDALARRNGGARQLVGLLLADRGPDFRLVARLAEAGFCGVMLDTAAKDGRSLRDVLTGFELAAFVDAAGASGLFAGLAGSLRLRDVAPLVRMEPDILGFRGALCAGGARTGTLSQTQVRDVRATLDLARRDVMRVPAA
ncbi:MAG: (5-formylfuran-3-yl)methyl phosphate synthase [Hyphomicrobiaceae bacterium]|nr:(5-formylfuran-3-yl)methyl phosphate synthase [Hyphomicrobiaceae bacterium]